MFMALPRSVRLRVVSSPWAAAVAAAVAAEAAAVAAALLMAALLVCAADLPQPMNATTMAFAEAYKPLFGAGNVRRSADDRTVSLLLDRSTGSGFMSSSMYQQGFASASIKLPSNYTAGVVVAFYTSNGDVFERTHDELDFEFLGNVPGKPWGIQTNVYGNGSVSRGREERYVLPFDPTAGFHRYSILWTSRAAVFSVDGTPVRELRRSPALGGDFPSKPMALYATIWDGSGWATNGGRDKADYAYSPFVAAFTDLAIAGCRADPVQTHGGGGRCDAAEEALLGSGLAAMTPERRQVMRSFREKNMIYSYCHDRLRYPVALPECDAAAHSARRRFKDSGHLLRRRRRTRGLGLGA